MSSKTNHQHPCTEPRSARLHLFGDNTESFLFDVESGRIHPLPDVHANIMETALHIGDSARAELTALALGMGAPVPAKAAPPESVPVKALSLAVSQKCNLGCTYCYAEQGTFGGEADNMHPDVAKASVDQLLKGIKEGEKVTLAFMGGEPLTNRKVLHASTHYAAKQAEARGVGISFSLTTNATLLLDEDIELFQKYRFTLTISIDGLKATNDQLRPFVSGDGSFEKISKNVNSLLSIKERSFIVFSRVTVTPRNLDLPEIMAGLLEMGFDAIMFSPMLTAPTGNEEMQAADLDKLLEQLIECGETFRMQLRQDRILPLSNIINTFQRIHSYEQDQYPCGAGGGYMGVSAKGETYACHRFVNDDEGHMGNVYNGIDAVKQTLWLKNRHLQNQSPCTTCWARYLCSGSCHYEVIKKGRPACDYIRGWLHYCLTVYTELMRDQPETLAHILKKN